MRHLRAKRRARPVSSASALSLSATAARSAPTTGDSRGKDLMKTSLKYLIPALQITKGVSSACPQLQLAVEALLIVLEAYKKYSEATEAIGTLLSRIQSLNGLLNKFQSEDSCPQPLKDSLVTLASELQEVVGDAERVQSKWWIVRLLRATDYAERIESWVKKLDQRIHTFLLERTIALEVTVHKGFDGANSRLDKADLKRANELNDGKTMPIRRCQTLSPHISALKRSLRPVIEALLYSGSSVHVQCHENTRVEVLSSLCSWLRPEHPPLSDLPILWLHALAGSGKSTIALTIADRWDKEGLLGASFFCARDGDRSNINCIFRTIAYRLALHLPTFREHLIKILEMEPDLYSSTPTRQLEKLIVEPLEALRASAKSEAPFPARVAIVIDALDECTDDTAVSTILKSLALHIGRLSPVKFLITSRPEENITRGFLQQSLDDNTQKLALSKIPEDLTRRDISAFLESRLADIREGFKLGASWPLPKQLENLISLSELLFIFAAAAVRYIGDQAERDPKSRLTALLDAGNAAAAKRGTSASEFSILDALYLQVLENAASRLGDNLKARLNLVLGTIVLAEQRLSPAMLDALLDLPTGTASRVLPVFGAILTISDSQDDTTPIRIIHLSFSNFLVDPTRCTDQGFLVRPQIHHSHIALRCLNVMKVLKYNILEVDSEHDHVLNDEIPDLPARLSRHIPAALEYACRYWTRHLCEAEVGEDLLTALKEFCTSHLLHWLETQSLQATDVPSLLYDCERAVRAFYPIISTSAMHMYSTVAIFAPIDTRLRRLAAAHARTSLVVRVGLENTWSTTLVSRVNHGKYIRTLTFSPDGTYVACTKWDRTVQLFNVHTGAELQVFKSHADKPIECLSFSPTSKEFLSGSKDGSIHLWDVATGANLNTWKVHSDLVHSVAWSPNGTLAASASLDNTARLWSLASPKQMVVLNCSGWVGYVVFAPDWDLLSYSPSGSCKIWNTRGVDWDTDTDIKPTRTLKHNSDVLTVAVSSDNLLVACGLFNGEIVLWNKSDGQRVRSLPGRSQVISLAFYPSGVLAAAYTETPFALWDVLTGAVVNSAGNKDARAAAFASDCRHIAHATRRQLHVRLWPSEQNAIVTTAITGRLKQLARRSSVEDREAVGNHRIDVRAVITSPMGNFALSEYADELQIYEASTGRCIRTIDHHIDAYSSAVWSPTGRLFACAGADHTVHVWEMDSGSYAGIVTGHTSLVNSVVFTRDEQHVLYASWDGTIRRGKIGGRTSSEVLFQSVGDRIWALAVSSDGQWILSASCREGSPPDTSSADLLAPPSRQPVQDNDSHYNALRLHDATTGHVVWIQHYPCWITSVAFSEDCTRALAGNQKDEVFLYDPTQIIPPHHAAPPLSVPEHKLSVRETHENIRRISFSPNGRAVITHRTYTSIPSELQPLHIGPTDRSLIAISFYDDDWLWRIDHPDADPRRLCWIPPMFRPQLNSVDSFSSAGGQFIVHFTLGGSLVIMDSATAC
ncbi:hypothetical protein C8Q73DRAFT_788949 [Cubamyces lactineus]|nr:hypothetical protein C8Q73DRAFT_788949 [Cubamyces lactineus]